MKLKTSIPQWCSPHGSVAQVATDVKTEINDLKKLVPPWLSPRARGSTTAIGGQWLVAHSRGTGRFCPHRRFCVHFWNVSQHHGLKGHVHTASL